MDKSNGKKMIKNILNLLNKKTVSMPILTSKS
jgi:hypothetical protein